MTDPAVSRSRRPTQPAAVILATALATLPILAFSQFIAHSRVDEHDAWLFAYYGREMLNGRALYTELWDNKPPGIFWLNALGLAASGGRLTGVWVLCALAVGCAAVAVFATAKRLYGWSAAGIVTVVASVYLNIWIYHVGCNRPNTFFVLTELASYALYCAALTGAGRRRCCMAAAGMCGGLGVWFKQSAVAFSATVILHSVYELLRGRLRVREVASRLGCFVGGWLAVAGLAAAALALTSDLGAAWDATVRFNRQYFLPGVGSSALPEFFAVDHRHLRAMALPVILAAATLVQPLLRRFVGGVPERDQDAVGTRPSGLLFLLWAWMACALYFALVGPHKRLPYYAVALPPLVMLAAQAIYLLLRSGRRISDTQPAYHAVVGVLWFGLMLYFPLHAQLEEVGKQHYHRFVEEPDPLYLQTLTAVRRHAGPDETVFVFGYGPKLYWQADRPPAIKYVGTEKVGQLKQYGQPLMDDITALLMAARPKAIVAGPEVFAKRPESQYVDLSTVQTWMKANYRPLPKDEAHDVWLRRD